MNKKIFVIVILSVFLLSSFNAVGTCIKSETIKTSDMGKPDFVLVDIDFLHHRIGKNIVADILITTRNEGATYYNPYSEDYQLICVGYYVDGLVRNWEDIRYFTGYTIKDKWESGEEKRHSYSIDWPDDGKEHELYVVVDWNAGNPKLQDYIDGRDDGQVEEVSETNNVMYLSKTIKAKEKNNVVFGNNLHLFDLLDSRLMDQFPLLKQIFLKE